MKSKLLSILLAASFIFTACGQDKNATETKEEPSKEVEQTQSVESNKEESNEEETQEEKKEEETATNDPNYIPEYKQVINPVTQNIQSSPGEVEKDNYFSINGLIGDYVQTGDSFIINHKYEQDKKILIIPVKVTNKYKEATTISVLTNTELQLIQEDDNSIYKCMPTSVLPDEYKNDLTTKIKVGGQSNYYLAFEIQNENLNFKLVSGLGEHIVFAEFKPE